MQNHGDTASEFDPIWPIAEDFFQRCQQGSPPSIESYAERYPELADAIREMFPKLREYKAFDASDQNTPTAYTVLTASTHGAVEVSSATIPQIPNYRIFQEIGRGGMGVVYEAEQLSLGRRVALKVLPAAFCQNKLAVSRFRQEARSAASLHHSNIVPVFEVGSTEDHNFYAMQYIIGDGLDRVIKALKSGKSNDRKAETRHRADESTDNELTSQLVTLITRDQSPSSLASETDDDFEEDPDDEFNVDQPAPQANQATIQVATSTTTNLSALTEKNRYYRNVARIGVEVAEALAHAHSQKVVHRDIKPSNILLDTSGRPWVADFGLAKTANVELTQSGSILGTLRYMSPERFSGPCGPRGDIYGLGATLYELLTLKPLFPGQDQLALIDQIKNDTPTSIREIDRAVPFDLETIVNKSLEKNPHRRYASAQQLADDLQRFLDGRPIHARRVSTVEKLRLWANNNRTTAALLGLLTVGLITVSIGSLIAANNYRNLLFKEKETSQKEIAATKLANEKAELAQLESETKDAINSFFRQLMNASDAQVNAKDITLRELLINTKDRVGFEDRPIIQGEIRRTIGKALSSLGQFDAAGEQLNLSYDLLKSALGPNDPKTMQTAMELGRYYRDSEQGDKATPFTRAYYQFAIETFGPEDPRTIQAMHMMGMILDDQGKSDEAEEFLIPVVNWRREHLGESNKDTINSIGMVGSMYLYEGRLIEAEPWVKEGAELSMQHLGPDDFTTMVLNHNLSQLYLDQKRYDEAEPRLRADYERTERLLGENHQGTIITLGKLASLYLETDRVEEAIHSKQIQIEKSTITFGPDSGMTFGYKIDLGNYYNTNLQPDLAREQISATLTEAVVSLGEDNWDTQKCRAALASLDQNEGNYQDAIDALLQVHAFASKKYGADNKRAWQFLSQLGNCYYMNQDYENARDAKQTVVGYLLGRGEPPTSLLEARRILFLSHLKLENYQTAIGVIDDGLKQIDGIPTPNQAILEYHGKYQLYKVVCLNELGQFDQALSLSTDMIESQSYPKSKGYYLPRLETNQGRALLGLENFEEAESILLAGYRGLTANDGDKYVKPAVQWLVELYEKSDQPDKADQWRAVLEEDLGSVTK